MVTAVSEYQVSFGQIELGAPVELKYKPEVLKVARGDGADEAALSIVRKRLGLKRQLQGQELKEEEFFYEPFQTMS